MQAARVWTLSDGHAGNLRQAAALAGALGLEAHDWQLDARMPWRLAAPRVLPGAREAFGATFAHALAQPPQLAIGCGRQGALATRLAGAAGARTVQILDPRIDPHHWDLVVAPGHDGLRGDNVLTLLGSLHPVDDAWLATARDAHPALGALPGPRTALLLGGPSRHVEFDLAAFERLAATLLPRITAEGGSLLATVSRRTPLDVVTALRARAADLPGMCWTGPGDGANPYAGLLAWADRIVCSADSVNMLSEASATRVPVFVAEPEGVRGRPRRFIDALLARGRVRTLDAALAPFDVEPLRETARIATLVRERLDLRD
ncbi:nucleoside-diphosphate sugar epimerase [Luteimonas yindakuii]|uniref:Nucleoside-diphosphate sugar epimerase n=1 Tax=Luteimonas yindakuii TaxID=2565782 RepID=A0A4Z1R5J7_9GAMM|nr:mitochondrial fission ELM1 family protein [Luteimonas yindakuii]TKS54892.1 nucleoside-diphosphate sugar epimerase [Luteimonas yindakuii]